MNEWITPKYNKDGKVIVPKFVAEWFEGAKDDLEYEIWSACREVGDFQEDSNQIEEWFCHNNGCFSYLVHMMEDGYVTEEEEKANKLWVIPLPNVFRDMEGKHPAYLVKPIAEVIDGSLKGFGISDNVNYSHQSFTRKEIESLGSPWSEIAIPLEEVEEL